MAPPQPPAPAGGPPATRPKGKLPLWAWLAAGAVGLVIGFFLLQRKGGATQADEGAPDEGKGEGKPAGGAVVVEPLEDLLGALGLTGDYQTPGQDFSGGSDGGGTGDSGDGSVAASSGSGYLGGQFATSAEAAAALGGGGSATYYSPAPYVPSSQISSTYVNPFSPSTQPSSPTPSGGSPGGKLFVQ